MQKIYPSLFHFWFCDLAIMLVLVLILYTLLWSVVWSLSGYSAPELFCRLDLLLYYTFVKKMRIK